MRLLSGNTLPRPAVALLAAAAAGLGGLAAEGCGGHSAGSRPTATPEATPTGVMPEISTDPNASLPTISNMPPGQARGLRRFGSELKVFTGRSLKGFISVDYKGQELDLISVDNTPPTVHPDDFIDTFRLVRSYARSNPKINIDLPDDPKIQRLSYTAASAPERRHFYLFAPAEVVGQLPAPALTALEFPRRQKGDTLTILADVGKQPTRFNNNVSGNAYDVAVETCNAITRIRPTTESKDLIIGLSGASGEDAKNLEIVMESIGQDIACNGLAAAISFAKSGRPYQEYKSDMSRARFKGYGPDLAGKYPLVGAATYKHFGIHKYRPLPK